MGVGSRVFVFVFVVGAGWVSRLRDMWWRAEGL